MYKESERANHRQASIEIDFYSYHVLAVTE